jgi:hypothetical protein
MHHPVALCEGGSVTRPRQSRYANDPRVTPTGSGYIVHAEDGTYVIRLNIGTQCWDVYLDNGVDLLPVAGGLAATGIRSHDDAIGALIGDAPTGGPDA